MKDPRRRIDDPDAFDPEGLEEREADRLRRPDRPTPPAVPGIAAHWEAPLVAPVIDDLELRQAEAELAALRSGYDGSRSPAGGCAPASSCRCGQRSPCDGATARATAPSRTPRQARFTPEQVEHIRRRIERNEALRLDLPNALARRKQALARLRARAASTQHGAGHVSPTTAAAGESSSDLVPAQLGDPPATPDLPLPPPLPNAYNTARGPAEVGWRTLKIRPDVLGRLLYYTNGFDLDSDFAAPVGKSYLDAVTRLVIVQHGSVFSTTTTETDFYALLITKTFKVLDDRFAGAGHAGEYAIVMPAFRNSASTSETYGDLHWPADMPGPLAGTPDLRRNKVVIWTLGQFGGGNLCANKALAGYITVFDVFDAIIDRALMRFENLQHVYVIGHSAGGQAAHRYALADTNLVPRLQAAVSTRYIACNPGYYSNLNPGRFCHPAIVPIGIENAGLPEDNEIPVPKALMEIEHFSWFQDPLVQISELYGGTLPTFTSDCADYDLAGGSRGFSTDDPELLSTGFERAAEALLPLPGPNETGFPDMVLLFASHYFERDVWHLQSRLDEDSAVHSCSGALMGPTRSHRWWAFREGLLRWGVDLDPPPPALQRFYAPDTPGDYHSQATMYPTDCVRVALDIIDEATSDIAQYHDNTWFTGLPLKS